VCLSPTRCGSGRRFRFPASFATNTVVVGCLWVGNYPKLTCTVGGEGNYGVCRPDRGMGFDQDPWRQAGGARGNRDMFRHSPGLDGWSAGAAGSGTALGGATARRLGRRYPSGPARAGACLPRDRARMLPTACARSGTSSRRSDCATRSQGRAAARSPPLPAPCLSPSLGNRTPTCTTWPPDRRLGNRTRFLPVCSRSGGRWQIHRSRCSVPSPRSGRW
jgi:hypothetical protein